MGARVARVVFGAFDPRAGAAGSALDVFGTRELSHRPACVGGVLAEEAARLLRSFFAIRRNCVAYPKRGSYSFVPPVGIRI